MEEGKNGLIVLVNKPYDDENPEFLAAVHNSLDNGVIKQIAEYLIDKQIQHSALQADNWERVLFDRATINGIQLMLDGFDILEAKYQEFHQPITDFNKHEVI